ncbi:UNVERIFIED_CONTAM: hypothetical protein FKN15_071941 [Acipenser sinensis]
MPCVPIRSGYGTVTLLCYVENDSNVTLPMLRDGATLNQTTSVNGTALELPQEIAEDVSMPCVPIRSGYGTVTLLCYVENDSNVTLPMLRDGATLNQTTSVNGTALELPQEIAEDNATFTSTDLNKGFERSRNVENAEAGQEIPMRAVTGVFHVYDFIGRPCFSFTGSESPDSVPVNAGVVQRDPSSQLPECTVLIQEGNHQVDGRN